MRIEIPQGALVLLIGVAGSGKTTFAGRHFRAGEILSSDAFRAMVADDEADQAASDDAFALLHRVAEMRLLRRLVTVVDATNVVAAYRRPLLAIAARVGAPTVAVVFDLPLAELHERNRGRQGRVVAPRVVRRQHDEMEQTLALLRAEGYVAIHVLESAGAVDQARVLRPPVGRSGRGW